MANNIEVITNDGRVESQFLPNFSKNPTVEYLVDYGLELTPSASLK